MLTGMRIQSLAENAKTPLQNIRWSPKDARKTLRRKSTFTPLVFLKVCLALSKIFLSKSSNFALKTLKPAPFSSAFSPFSKLLNNRHIHTFPKTGSSFPSVVYLNPFINKPVLFQHFYLSKKNVKQ